MYLGSHWGNEDDGYLCSSNWMRSAYNRRPQDFKRRIIKQMTSTYQDLIQEEQRYLDMIKPEEFGIKYYNYQSKAKGWSWHQNEQTKRLIAERIGQSQKGKVRTKEAKEKYRQSALNQWQTMDEETKKKLLNNLNKTGETPWNKGITKKDDDRIKCPITCFKQGHTPWNKGKKTGIRTKGSEGMKWYNNGIINKLCLKKPDETFVLGRIKGFKLI